MSARATSRRKKYQAIVDARLEALQTKATEPVGSDCKECGGHCGHKAQEFCVDDARELEVLFKLDKLIHDEDEPKEKKQKEMSDEEVQRTLAGPRRADDLFPPKGPKGPHTL